MVIIGVFLNIFFSSKYLKQYLSYNPILTFSIRPIPSTYMYALFGFTLFHLNNVVKFKKYIIKISLLFLITFYLNIYDKNLFIKIVACISLFIAFLNLPIHKMNNNLFKFLTSYSGGIYYLHPKMQMLLEYFFYSMKSKTIKVCIINYLLCALFCLIGSKLFKKVNLRYLFE